MELLYFSTLPTWICESWLWRNINIYCTLIQIIHCLLENLNVTVIMALKGNFNFLSGHLLQDGREYNNASRLHNYEPHVTHIFLTFFQIWHQFLDKNNNTVLNTSLVIKVFCKSWDGGFGRSIVEKGKTFTRITTYCNKDEALLYHR